MRSGASGSFPRTRAVAPLVEQALELPARTRAHTGAVSVVQRGDSALRLNVHFHVLVLDGVYVRDAAGKLVFNALAPPTSDEVTEVAVRTATRLQKVLARHGKLLEDATVDTVPKAEQLALSALVGAAASGLGLAGERAGKPLLRVVDPAKARIAERVGESLGVNVPAEVAVPARDRARLERLCSSGGRAGGETTPRSTARTSTDSSAGRGSSRWEPRRRRSPRRDAAAASSGLTPLRSLGASRGIQRALGRTGRRSGD
jgi:hypothetical protein